MICCSGAGRCAGELFVPDERHIRHQLHLHMSGHLRLCGKHRCTRVIESRSQFLCFQCDNSTDVEKCISVSNPPTHPGGGINLGNPFSFLGLSLGSGLGISTTILIVIIVFFCCCAKSNGGCKNCCSTACCCCLGGSGGTAQSGSASDGGKSSKLYVWAFSMLCCDHSTDVCRPFSFKLYLQTVVVMCLLPLASLGWFTVHIIQSIRSKLGRVPTSAQEGTGNEHPTARAGTIHRLLKRQKAETAMELQELHQELAQLRTMQDKLQLDVQAQQACAPQDVQIRTDLRPNFVTPKRPDQAVVLLDDACTTYTSEGIRFFSFFVFSFCK